VVLRGVVLWKKRGRPLSMMQKGGEVDRQGTREDGFVRINAAFAAMDALHSTLSKCYSVCLDQLVKVGVNPREIEGKTHTAKKPSNARASLSRAILPSISSQAQIKLVEKEERTSGKAFGG